MHTTTFSRNSCADWPTHIESIRRISAGTMRDVTYAVAAARRATEPLNVVP